MNISLKRRYDTPTHEQLKHSVSTNSAAANKKTQNTEKGVKCCDHWDKIETISQINQSYLVSTTHILPTF